MLENGLGYLWLESLIAADNLSAIQGVQFRVGFAAVLAPHVLPLIETSGIDAGVALMLGQQLTKRLDCLSLQLRRNQLLHGNVRNPAVLDDKLCNPDYVEIF